MTEPVQNCSAGIANEALKRIAILCTQHMDRDCNHRMALDAARQIANDILDAAQSVGMREALEWYAKDYDHALGCSQWDGGARARAVLASQPSPAAPVGTVQAVVTHMGRGEPQPFEDEDQPPCSAASEPVAWLCEYDGHTDATTDPDTVRIWTETLKRTVTPLYRTVPQEASDTIAVPKKALAWLFGEGPDEKGYGFGECYESQKALNAKNPRRYWWRSKFRKMVPALAVSRPHGN
jgi:hypothetical protein